jgi:hypothetical protein
VVEPFPAIIFDGLPPPVVFCRISQCRDDHNGGCDDEIPEKCNDNRFSAVTAVGGDLYTLDIKKHDGASNKNCYRGDGIAFYKMAHSQTELLS